MTTADDRTLAQIREQAYIAVDPMKIGHTNLAVDHTIREEGDHIGPVRRRVCSWATGSVGCALPTIANGVASGGS